VGHITQRDFQKVLDQKLDLTDEECALLIENLTYSDGTHKHDVDYSFLLLILQEPIVDAPITAGAALMNKMSRGADVVSLRRLLALLFRNCAAYDTRMTGLVQYEDAEKSLKEECHNIEPKVLTQMLKGFQDPKTEDIMYPELISFLGNCAISNIINRLNNIDSIRQRQGYNLKDFILNI
jgi:Ca2+-binding EF-hand superfamily protein